MTATSSARIVKPRRQVTSLSAAGSLVNPPHSDLLLLGGGGGHLGALPLGLRLLGPVREGGEEQKPLLG